MHGALRAARRERVGTGAASAEDNERRLGRRVSLWTARAERSASKNRGSQDLALRRNVVVHPH